MNYRKHFVWILVVGLSCCFLGACDFSDKEESKSKETISKVVTEISTKTLTDLVTEMPSEISSDNIDSIDEENKEKAVKEPVTEVGDRFTQYLNLLMMTLEDADNALGEESEKTEDESFDYKKNGIRVWVDRGVINQVLITGSDVSFNGAYVGDNVQRFKDIFGEPSQDVNGEVHFSYECTFLVIPYDIETGRTVSVYLLSEDYAEEDYKQ
ncbi:MAG TPA: hypothetical protein VHQ24_07210 [Lachnospiraceae bacterium]|nr:hypothetical protein [Lachnospiraceae bacterium]